MSTKNEPAADEPVADDATEPQGAPAAVDEQPQSEEDKLVAQHKLTIENSEKVRGADHPGTLRARSDLATAYWKFGRYDEAIDIEEALVEDTRRVLGPEHPEALTARANLASSYWTAGRSQEAIDIEEAVLADAERLLGNDHLATLTARSNPPSPTPAPGARRMP
jgi:tetratricopeptide (TPR) repeat protein